MVPSGALYEIGVEAYCMRAISRQNWKVNQAPPSPPNFGGGLLEIRQILETWHELLEPDQIIDDYQQELTAAQKLTTDEKLKVYIHGKKFFKQVILPTLNSLFGQARTNIWLERFIKDPFKLPPPPDLHRFLEDVLKLF
jgi:hypothetical protein